MRCLAVRPQRAPVEESLPGYSLHFHISSPHRPLMASRSEGTLQNPQTSPRLLICFFIMHIFRPFCPRGPCGRFELNGIVIV
jgi:hypothetical protein